MTQTRKHCPLVVQIVIFTSKSLGFSTKKIPSPGIFYCRPRSGRPHLPRLDSPLSHVCTPPVYGRTVGLSSSSSRAPVAGVYFSVLTSRRKLILVKTLSLLEGPLQILCMTEVGKDERFLLT